jgi:hypothetical protein
MSSNHTHETTFQIGDQSILLKVGFSYTGGYPATGPSYASGGEPACGPEVDIYSLEWSYDSPATNTVAWKIIDGDLFHLIADDDALYNDLCDAAEGEFEAAKEEAAERRYEMQREDRA